MKTEKGLINSIEIIEAAKEAIENIIASGEFENLDLEGLKKCKSAIKYLNQKRNEKTKNKSRITK